ncbi:MAG: carboxypeptidase regulatory-like domain-containing protein [Acidothermus sp.]|nr:carboxypeptidase regulatory-like domain-containing protein [Acidothermus sp.]MCL6537657.1 carboxypeptidase-like regulatory domain-containing protein [Acidothermus sp.]
MSEIGSIRLTPPNPRPGQTVLVEVLDEKNALITDSFVSVDGRPGPVHHLQFPDEGTRTLLVRRIDAAGSETKEVTIPVSGPELTFKDPHLGKSSLALLSVRQAQGQPYRATFHLGRPSATLPVHPAHPGKPAGPVLPTQLATSLKTGRLATILAERGRPITSTTGPLVRPSPKRGPSRRFTSTVVHLDEADIAEIIGAQRRESSEPRFIWDFGDGTKVTTVAPYVEHDYRDSLGPNDEYGVFHVTCTAVADQVTVSRTLIVHSAYALCKQRGAIVPHLDADIYATKTASGFTGTFTVHNIEDFPLTLDRMAIVPLADAQHAGDDLAVPTFTVMSSPVVVPANSTTVIAVHAPYSETLPDHAPGFTVYYGGTGNGTKVRISHTFELSVADQHRKPPSFMPPSVPSKTRQTWPWEEVEKSLVERLGATVQPHATNIDRATGTLAISLPRGSTLNSSQTIRTVVSSVLAAAGARTAPSSSRETVVARSHVRLRPEFETGSSSRLSAHVSPLDTPRGFHPLPPPPPQPGIVAEGQICDPDNISGSDRAQAEAQDLVCQLTSEQVQVTMPARFMNARKGDVILSPGDSSIIGSLLRQVNPPQKYSHSGIMTRNYDEITHSTASEKWLLDHLAGVLPGSDGFDPVALKYLWPGVVRQSVDAAINGEDFISPEGKTYKIDSFSPRAIGVTANDHFEIVPPLVVKPDPLEETSSVRAALHAAAIEAATGAGRPTVRSKSHYRFYGYTDPLAVLTPAGADAGWAAGTYGTVCSSFIWSVHRALGHHMEATTSIVMPTDLEAADVAAGAEVGANNPDGLYRYTAAERAVAGQWLYNYIYAAAADKAGWLGGLLTDAPDDTANQFVNAFANDDTTGTDSTAWQQTTDALAISPDNILFWDPPSKGGLYGYAEPLQYREPRIETYTVSRWKRVLTKGRVHGTVSYQGQPVAGATVSLYDGALAITAADGTYTLDNIPFGNYQLRAQKVIDGVLCEANETISLTVADLPKNLALQGPPEENRVAQVYVDFYGVDDEYWPFDDEIDDPGPEYYEVAVNPGNPIGTLVLPDYRWGGEMRVHYTLTFRLLANNDIDVTVQCNLYEGTDEDTTDLDGVSSMEFTVPRDQTIGNTLRTDNTDEGGDWCTLAVSVKNARNTA